MSKELKVGIIVAVVEAILLLIVHLILFNVEKKHNEQQTLEILTEYFGSVDDSMSYEQALKSIYEDSKKVDEQLQESIQANEKLKEEIEALKRGNEELKNQVETEEVNEEIINSAKAYAESKDYERAIAILNSFKNKTPMIEELLYKYIKQYEAQIVSDADAMVNNGEYDNAIKLIDNALKIVDDSTLFAEKKDEISNSKPKVFINVLSPYEKSYYHEIGPSEYCEMGGTRYTNGFLLGGEWTEPAYAIYNLNAQYTSISGMIGHVDGSGNAEQVVTIFADGVLIDTIEIGYQDLPREFNIDVKEVKQLKFYRTDGDEQTGFVNLVIQ